MFLPTCRRCLNELISRARGSAGGRGASCPGIIGPIIPKFRQAVFCVAPPRDDAARNGPDDGEALNRSAPFDSHFHNTLPKHWLH